MRKPIITTLLILLLACVAGAQDKQTEYGVDIVQTGRVETHAFFIKELVKVEDGLPLVQAYLGKVRIVDGKFDVRLFLPISERYLQKYILKNHSKFRLYIDAEHVGIFTYQPVPNPKKRKKGVYFKALPIDKDASLKRITGNVKEKASLENLLDMSLEDAMKTADKETVINGAFNKLVQMELDTLKKVKAKGNKNKDFIPFLVVTKAVNDDKEK